MTQTAPPAERTAQTVVSFENVHKSYGDVRAVSDLSLALHPGETVALLGPNGAGKSSTLDLLLGLRNADSGSVRLFGMTPAQAINAGKVGAMLQSGGLMEDVTVRELVKLGCDLHPHPYPVAEVMDRAGIAQIADRKVNKLSGGQEQRVRFALATAGANDLIVLDEPTTGMDVTARQAFWATMREQAAQGRTVLFATHYLEEADAIADRVLVLHKGRAARRRHRRRDQGEGGRPPGQLRPGGRHRRSRPARAPVPLHDRHLGPHRPHPVARRRRHDARGVRARPLPPQPRSRRPRPGAGLRRHHLGRGGQRRMNTLIKLEITRTLRNKKFMFFSVIYPSALYLLFAASQNGTTKVKGTDLTFPALYMVSMASFGAITAVLMGNSEKIAKEREKGWVRQLRLTTLPGRGYVLAKIASAAVVTLPCIVVVFLVAAGTKGVRFEAWQWGALTVRHLGRLALLRRARRRHRLHRQR